MELLCSKFVLYCFECQVTSHRGHSRSSKISLWYRMKRLSMLSSDILWKISKLGGGDHGATSKDFCPGICSQN